MLAADMATTLHIHPTADLSERVLLPGDPGRALLLAQSLLERPKMFNHHRGLWGYTGAAADGEPLTIQSTGMGGPSAAIVIEELARLGARRLVRVGSCGALLGGFALGDAIVAEEAIASDGTSRALGAGERVAADAALTDALTDAAAGEVSGGGKPGGPGEPGGGAVRRGAVVTTDLFYDPAGEHADPSDPATPRSRSRWRPRPCSSSPRCAACRPAACSSSATCSGRSAAGSTRRRWRPPRSVSGESPSRH